MGIVSHPAFVASTAIQHRQNQLEPTTGASPFNDGTFGGSSNEPNRLSDEERHAKRARFVDEIVKGPAYKAYLASKARGEAKARRVPEAPDASDPNISKRQFEEKSRRWREGLKKFGDLYP